MDTSARWIFWIERKPAMSHANEVNNVVWVDIPVVDLERAIRFYDAVLGGVTKDSFDGMEFGIFMHEEGNGGCLAAMPGVRPSRDGVLIYLNANGRLDEAIAAVEPNGGKVLEPKREIGPHGYRAIVLDSEGNRVALHSR